MTTSAGWYPDPNDARFERYWDGVGWTDRVDETLVAESAPPLSPAPSVAPAPQPVVAEQVYVPPAPEPIVYIDHPPAPDSYRPLWKKKRVLIPAGVFVLLAIGAAFSPSEDAPEDIAVDAIVEEEVAGPVVETTATEAATATTAAPTTTVEVATTLTDDEYEDLARDLLGPTIIRGIMEDEGHDLQDITDDDLVELGDVSCTAAEAFGDGQGEAFELSVLDVLPDTIEGDGFWITLTGAAMGVYCDTELERLGIA